MSNNCLGISVLIIGVGIPNTIVFEVLEPPFAELLHMAQGQITP